ncbi:hypothetical protein RvY_18253 [Ramazzottius varieornatus]|uniref:CLIC N-terminal domain-containing protein n=1 Tax=Ramazzottius varieornatus TaxID=947166 RepID=A0A1D1W536_RAMVA|nr:hypothetical protein RvY_18253 [Ramazzottius varieornatus]
MDERPEVQPKPAVKLFVKAGADGMSYGACLNSQRLFMVLTLKAQGGALNYSVHAVNLSKPTEEFTTLGLHNLPAISYLYDHLDKVEDIVEYLDCHFYKVDLSYDNIIAAKACKDFFPKFCFYIKSISKDAYGLTLELDRLDKYLSGRAVSKGPFLCGGRMTHLDCEVLPKLQQIRVAGKALKGFDIPETMLGLWSYLKAAYATEAFRDACPSDEEILLHWMDRTEMTATVSTPKRERSTLMDPPQQTHSFHTPLDSSPTEISKSDTPKAATSTTSSGPLPLSEEKERYELKQVVLA